jgi:hypothetical protein
MQHLDRLHNIMILGHVMLQHTIPCSGTTQMRNRPPECLLSNQ